MAESLPIRPFSLSWFPRGQIQALSYITSFSSTLILYKTCDPITLARRLTTCSRITAYAQSQIDSNSVLTDFATIHGGAHSICFLVTCSAPVISCNLFNASFSCHKSSTPFPSFLFVRTSPIKLLGSPHTRWVKKELRCIFEISPRSSDSFSSSLPNISSLIVADRRHSHHGAGEYRASCSIFSGSVFSSSFVSSPDWLSFSAPTVLSNSTHFPVPTRLPGSASSSPLIIPPSVQSVRVHRRLSWVVLFSTDDP